MLSLFGGYQRDAGVPDEEQHGVPEGAADNTAPDEERGGEFGGEREEVAQWDLMLKRADPEEHGRVPGGGLCGEDRELRSDHAEQ